MVSPLLWKKVARGLSAGRVQSVATRLVVEREREIKAFVPEEYWDLFADLDAAGASLRAQVVKHAGAAFKPTTGAEAEVAVAALQGASYRVASREDKPAKAKPYPPFITSTLQQAASVRLGFGVKKTMTLAQRLYEAGLITYMRTDSRALSKEAVAACREHIGSTYGERYLPEKPQVYASGASAQEAHEAIRPTDVRTLPDMAEKLERDQQRLYQLIWQQFVACQMPPAEFDTSSVSIAAADYELRARGRVLRFDGWQRVLPPVGKARKKDDDSDVRLPDLTVGQDLGLVALDPKQHFTKPPARFNEASLVKELEKRSIGRPSTYAAIISTIQDRGYVRMDGKRMYAEKMGEIVTDRLVESFDRIMDYGFTASLEEELDQVAAGSESWRAVLDTFYARFKGKLDRADSEMRPNDPVEIPEVHCPDCDRTMAVRTASTGVFLGCTGYSLSKKEGKCTKTLNLTPGEEAVEADADDEVAETDALRAKRRCPLCASAMDAWLIDEERKLHICGSNPDCPGHEIERGAFKIKGYDGPILECDKCGADMQLKSGRFGKYFGCTADACKNTRKLLRSGEPAPPKMDPVPCPELPCQKVDDDHYLLRDGAAGLFLAASKYPRVRETRNPTVAEIAPHRGELPEKYHHLADGPQDDPDGNAYVIRFSRKTKDHYLAAEDAEGKRSGYSALWVDGAWQVSAPAKKSAAKKK
jgi:DNA topoisomerase-1